MYCRQVYRIEVLQKTFIREPLPTNRKRFVAEDSQKIWLTKGVDTRDMEEIRKSLSPDADVTQVIEFYSNMVYRLAFARTGTKEDAEDVYEEVFLRYIRKKPTFESEEHRRAWFLRVTVNCSNTFLTSVWQKRTEGLSEEILFSQKEHQSLYRELQQLPVKYRSVIHSFYYEELSVEEIGQILHRKPSTVRTQLTRARELLREMLKEEDYDF